MGPESGTPPIVDQHEGTRLGNADLHTNVVMTAPSGFVSRSIFLTSPSVCNESVARDIVARGHGGMSTSARLR